MSIDTVVFGYSPNPERFSFKAYELLREHNISTLAFNPQTDSIDHLPNNFNTLTLYISAQNFKKFESEVLGFQFKRVIFNPGTENSEFKNLCLLKGIEVVEDCTLVMLRQSRY